MAWWQYVLIGLGILVVVVGIGFAACVAFLTNTKD